ncbi:uncharacterized protein LOC111339005 [Stylophora pistillata]|uniref:uncharacterized protein LOC111339005 n=1 Tax=Stylophora pistillata TaxID=50429 RepID=UPI000C03A4B1|nr:uncharacterized protein LOC111339005 [Stylophora pistillata]
MSIADNCNKQKILIAAGLIVVLTIIGLAIGLTVKKHQAEKDLPYATRKWELPTSYKVRRPKGVEIYKNMLYLTPEGGEIGHARKCVTCVWTVYMLNKKEELAVTVKRELFTWTSKYDIVEEWKVNSTSYRIEYSWSASGFTKNVFLIKNSKDEEIARTDRFVFEIGTTITLKDSKSGSSLGVIERPAFQFYPTWEVTIYKRDDVIPTYMYAALATITTFREAEDNKR